MTRLILILLSGVLLAAQDREGFLSVPGGPVWYRVIGEGKQTPILAVHGGPGGTSCGLLALAPLASDRRLVVFDQLGSGRSGRPRDPQLWTVERFVEELHAVRNKLGLRKVHLLGHSWGGTLVAEYVLRKGSRGIASLVLVSPMLSTKDWIRDAEGLRSQLPPEVQETLRAHEAAGTTDSAEYRAAEQEFNRRFVARNPSPPNPECRGSAFNRVIYQQMWGPSEFHATGSLKSFDITPELPRLRVPVLLMVGEFDEATPATAARYQKMIPGARLEVILGAAHSVWSDNAAASLKGLEDFLRSVR